MTLNAKLAKARDQLARMEDDLAAAYEKPLRAAAAKAVARFRAVAVVAATQPRWEPPSPDDLVDGQKLAADAQAKTRALRAQALQAVGAAAIGTSFDVATPFAQLLLGGLDERSRQIVAGYGNDLAAVIRDAHAQGLSVENAAKLIQQQAPDVTRVTARLLARTDLNSIANGGGQLAAQLVNQASVDAGEPGISGKTWVTAGDERVREDHADADGQTVPLDQPFDVGGEQLIYPGDPQGSLEQIANCRCVVTFGESEAASGAPPTVALPSRVTMSETLAVTAAATGDTSLPLSGRDEAWDAGAARKSLNPDDFAKAHFWRDPDGPADQIGSYKLPFARRTDSGLVAVWKGVTAAAQRLSATQGIDRTAVQRKIGAFYRKAAKQYSDDAIKTPWAIMRDFHLTAAAGMPTRWQATLLVEGEPTEDGRMIAEGATSWRGLPLPLMAMTVTDEGHDGAQLVGRIDQIWRAGNLIQGAGVFNDADGGFAAEVVQMVRDRMLTGISVDPAGADMEIVVTQNVEPDEDDMPAEGEGPGEIADVPDLDYLCVYTDLVIGAATICPVQAVANARIELVASADHPPVVTEFDPTLCEVPAEVADAAQAGSSEILALAAALADRPTRVEYANVPDYRDQIDQIHAALTAAAEFQAARFAELNVLQAEALTEFRGEIEERIGRLSAKQEAALTASAAALEAVEGLAWLRAAVDQIQAGVARAVDIAERKPREVRFERDENGRLAGLRED